MNILNKGFKPFAEQGNVIIYTKTITGKLTQKREQIITNWIDNINKKTNYICYGWKSLNWDKLIKNEYHIYIEILNNDL